MTARANGRRFAGVIFAVAGLSPIALGGCSPGPMIDRLPSDIGLPSGAPARPASPYQYPTVHDMPPPRSAPTMSEEDQIKAEKDLIAVRNRQQKLTGTQPKDDKKKPGQTAKKKPSDENGAQSGVPAAGGKANP